MRCLSVVRFPALLDIPDEIFNILNKSILASRFGSKSMRLDAGNSEGSSMESDQCKEQYEDVLQLSKCMVLGGKTLKPRLIGF